MIISIIIALVVGALVFVAARYGMDAIKVPQPFYNLILALIIAAIAIWIGQIAGLL